jgi:hypothetical protein
MSYADRIDPLLCGPSTLHSPACMNGHVDYNLQEYRACHGRLPRAKAGKPQISADRPDYATSTWTTKNSSPATSASVWNEQSAPSVAPTHNRSELVSPASPFEASTGQGGAFLAALGAAVVSFAACSRRSSLAPSSYEYEERIAVNTHDGGRWKRRDMNQC